MSEVLTLKPFDLFILEFKQELSTVFEEKRNAAATIYQRLWSEAELKKIMSHIPLSVAVPSAFGGRGMKVKECLSVLEAASYESLPLSLTFGINIALFLEPFAKYGKESIKEEVFNKFINNQALGGLMISEPDYGSDALNIQTCHTKKDDSYHVKGTKHWQGLSGMADFWLIASREKTRAGTLGRDLNLFFADRSKPNQEVPCVEIFNNNGLYPIPYGINDVDINVPQENMLTPESTGIKMIMDLLHRSRMQFPGMGMGFLKRILETATDHCTNRKIRGNSLFQFDQVNRQIAELQSAFTICSAMCNYSSKISGIDASLAVQGIEANTMKARITDLMQDSAQTLMQLQGSKGYHIESLGSRAIMDSRPFQIFEGPNEMLYAQISEGVTKEMGRKKISLIEYFENREITKDVVSYYKSAINITGEKSMSQRKHVIFGEVVSRMFTAGYVKLLENNGFNSALIYNALDMIKQEIENLVNAYHSSILVSTVENFKIDSRWQM